MEACSKERTGSRRTMYSFYTLWNGYHFMQLLSGAFLLLNIGNMLATVTVKNIKKCYRTHLLLSNHYAFQTHIRMNKMTLSPHLLGGLWWTVFKFKAVRDTVGWCALWISRHDPQIVRRMENMEDSRVIHTENTGKRWDNEFYLLT